MRAIGPGYLVTPSGLQLAAPAHLTFNFSVGELATGASVSVFGGLSGVAPEHALPSVASTKEVVAESAVLVEYQVAIAAPQACESVGESCQTAQDCCAATCDGSNHCAPFEVDAGACNPISGACAADGDCCSGHCSTDVGLCLSGYPVTCQADSQCPSGTICRECLSECVYPPDGYCDSSAPCDCGFSCQGHVCIATSVDAGPPGCTANSDCPTNEACNPHTSQCQFPMCAGIVGQGLADGGAAAPVPCAPGAEGRGCPAGLSCIFVGFPGLDFACLQPCDYTTECPVGFCSYGAVSVCGFDCTHYCATNSDCPSTNGPPSICENGACVRGGC